MEFVDTGMGLPIKSWCEDIEAGSMKQAANLANLPFAFRHIALMPDCHLGYGMPIGGVMATQGVIIPNAVGVDIGCGMIANKTEFPYPISKDEIKEIFTEVRKVIPVGFKHHQEEQSSVVFAIETKPDIPIIQQEWDSAKRQIGTLGSGNHFIELQRGSDKNLWLMIHSGSRNFGLKIAKTYHNIAKKLCEKWFSDIPDKDLSFLPMDSEEGQEYFEAMKFALLFAAFNRRMMMQRFMEIVTEQLNCAFPETAIDVHHNYARMENHFGKNVMVHRKGATSAKEGELGIIPGSQGTRSYIIEGLGNKESFMSCSHGAGRKMGRKEAKRVLNLEEEQKILDSKGIIHSVRGVDNLDEASGAYKDIDVVMKSQEDLVKIKVELTPLGVIKG